MTVRLIVSSCLVFACLSLVALGQQMHLPLPKTQVGEPAKEDAYSVTKLTLAPGKPVAGLDRSHVVIRPLQCTASGEVLMEVPLPPDFREFRVESLSRSGGHSFDFKAIPELYDIVLMSFFPSESDVDFLFLATGENKISDYRMMTDKGKVVTGKANKTEHHYYLVRFGLDGQYKSKARLPDGPQYWKVAALASGEPLLLSYDPANRVPVLQVTDSDGTPINSIPLLGKIADYSTLNRSVSEGDLAAAKASTSVSSWQFVPARGKVLLYRPKSNAPILEIGDGGYVREVPITGPNGYQIESFLPSAKHWFAIFRRSDFGDDHAEVDSHAANKKFVMVELSPYDGSVERMFEMDDGSFFNIACEVDDQLISYSVDLGSQILLSYTDLPN